MKSVVVLLCFCACLFAGLSACGQKGPLYLPQPDKPAPENSAHEKAQR